MCNLKIIINTSYRQDDIDRYRSLKPKRARRADRACLQCQARKIKCAGGSPCECCKARKVECVYSKKPPKQYTSSHNTAHPSSDTPFKPRPSLNQAPSHITRNHPSRSSLDLAADVVDPTISPSIKAASSRTPTILTDWSDSMRYDKTRDTLDTVLDIDSGSLPELPERSFVTRFYKLMGSYLPYVDRKTFEHRLIQGPLSTSALYSMAALVSRVDAVIGDSNNGDNEYSIDSGDSLCGDGGTKGAMYAQASKGLIFPYISTPSLDVIYTLVLIAYNEFAEARDSGLWAWSGMAIRMCYDMGLNNPECAKAYDQVLYRYVFGSVVCLDRIVSLSTGRKTSIPDQDLMALAWLIVGDDRLIPSPQSMEVYSPFHHLCQLMTIAGRVSNWINSNQCQGGLSLDQATMASCLDILNKFHAQLSTQLYFDIHNFQAAEMRNQSQAFLMIHIWHQTLLIMVNCPLWSPNYLNTTSSLAIQDQPSLAQSHLDTVSQCVTKIADMISLADLINPNAYLASPFVAQPLYFAACTALNLSRIHTNTQYREYSIKKAYDTCRSALTRMQTIWQGISSHLRSLASLHDSAPHDITDDVEAEPSGFSQNAHIDELACDSTFLESRDAGGGLGAVSTASDSTIVASTISPFSLSSTTSIYPSDDKGFVPWGGALESTSDEKGNWVPELPLWNISDWDTTMNPFLPPPPEMLTPRTTDGAHSFEATGWNTAIGVGHPHQKPQPLTNISGSGSLTGTANQFLVNGGSTTAIDSHLNSGLWMGDIGDQDF